MAGNDIGSKKKAVIPASKKAAAAGAKLPVKRKTAAEKADEFHRYLMREGTDSRAYTYFGAHFETKARRKGVTFRVWAPNAKSVSVVGDFNHWDGAHSPMTKKDGGVWEAFVTGLSEYDNYKYLVEPSAGKAVLKADPYAFHSETRPGTASKLYNLEGYEWNDGDWAAAKSSQNAIESPVNIYEMHIGSWKRHENGACYNYSDLADILAPYLKEMGYTHVELLPIKEHPLDASWGYQVSGYFAPTSRYGTPKDFMAFVDKLHQSGIGVILDWVPAHFPKDGFGLYKFDGTWLYEYDDPLKREHLSWGTHVFDFSKKEVCSFLISSAIFWFDYFHIDGLRIDAVASMLYLDYDRQGGKWRPNKYGGRENIEVIDFLRSLNEMVFTSFPSALMMAEESTAWPMVTKPPYLGGLGFNFKWNMGWMNDSLRYASMDPWFRQYNHDLLTFSLFYCFSENYVLPLSHDEVVHMKRSLVKKMPGDVDMQFSGLRAYMGYMIAHPGKKLLFMGGEFGQYEEWSEARELDWHVLKSEHNRLYKNFVARLNHIYIDRPALWQVDNDWAGFEWLCNDDYSQNIIAFRRTDKEGRYIVVICNFSPVKREKYLVGLPHENVLELLINSDDEEFGGSGCEAIAEVSPVFNGWNGKPFMGSFTIPPLSSMLYASTDRMAQPPVVEELPFVPPDAPPKPVIKAAKRKTVKKTKKS